MLAALAPTVVTATMTVERATYTEVFCAYVSPVLKPTLRRG
jgi:hypothetical protein